PVAPVDERHARGGATLLVDAGIALDDEPDAVAGVLGERAGVDVDGVGTGAGALEHGRPVQAVAHRRRADAQRRLENAAHVRTSSPLASAAPLTCTNASRSWASASRSGAASSPRRSPKPSTRAARASMASWAWSSWGGSSPRWSAA